MTDQQVPADSGAEEPNPPMNRAERRAQRRGKQPPTTPESRFGGGGRPVPLPPRRSGRRGNR